MTKDELEKATGQELIDARNYCGVDGYYRDYLENVNAEMLKRFNRLAELERENAGLKARRSKWHKVADGDLPKENKRYICKIKGFVGGGISYECFGYDTEYGSWKDACGEVIAWCEIPKFEETKE